MSAALEAQKLSVKFFVRPPSPVTEPVHGDEFVPVFHKWIQDQALPQHLLLDVAAYHHVIDGPGVVLVSHEANIAADYDAGKLGLLYFRKQPLAGEFAQRLRQVVDNAQHCAHMLEQSLPGKVPFDFNHLRLRIHDRLRAPNDAQTLEAVKPVAAQILREFWGSAATVESTEAANELFTLQITRG